MSDPHGYICDICETDINRNDPDWFNGNLYSESASEDGIMFLCGKCHQNAQANYAILRLRAIELIKD